MSAPTARTSGARSERGKTAVPAVQANSRPRLFGQAGGLSALTGGDACPTYGLRYNPKTMKLKLLVVLALIIIIAIGFAWWWNRENGKSQELALHGNVDLRQPRLELDRRIRRQRDDLHRTSGTARQPAP